MQQLFLMINHSLIQLQKQLIRSDAARTAFQFHQNFIYQQEQKQSFWADEEHTMQLCTPNFSNIFPKTIKTIHRPSSKKINSLPQRVSNKIATRRATRSPKSRHSKICREISKLRGEISEEELQCIRELFKLA